jgi:tRNA G18 (ribose-2'-O)-methylase SpoU
MSVKQKSVCDAFVYIPQYGQGTASLNVNVATGIVLNWYSDRKIRRCGDTCKQVAACTQDIQC